MYGRGQVEVGQVEVEVSEFGSVCGTVHWSKLFTQHLEKGIIAVNGA